MNRLMLVLVPLVAIVLTGCGSDDNPVGVEDRTINVPSEAPTIQAGIEAASAGDWVLVACGTYFEHDIEMKSGVYLTSETGQANCVTIDAQQQGRVFYCNGVDSLASIVGFTITGGLADGENPDDSGGGMYCYNSSLALTNCTFEENHASGDDTNFGGGMYCHNASPTLTSCTFEENGARAGGGMYCYGSSPTLTGCAFLWNDARSGGGMFCSDYSSPTLTGCTFYSNHTVIGGGMYCTDHSSPTLMACTLAWNLANVGGGMYCTDFSSPALRTCIIAFSMSGNQAEAIHCDDETSAPLLTCCDLYGNDGGDWIGCIADQNGVAGNFSEDPRFCDSATGDFTLASDSPCLPSGNHCWELIGAHGEGCW